MRQRTESQGVPYSYLVDNIKVLLIFLVVFNHLIAFQLVKADIVVRYVWYAITIFHMVPSCGMCWHCLSTDLP